MVDRGDRALELDDDDHPGLPDDDRTERSDHGSEYVPDDDNGGGLLALDFVPDGSFVDASSHHDLVSRHASADEEEAKVPEPNMNASNVHMSGDSNRLRRDRNQSSRAGRALMSNVLQRIDNFQAPADNEEFHRW